MLGKLLGMGPFKIHRDVRGTIWMYRVEGVQFNVIFTNKGFLRGGEFHETPQYCAFLKGRLKITLHKGTKDVVVARKAGEMISIPPRVPHLFASLTDSLFVEWWGGPHTTTYYQPYRRLVEERMRSKS